jgi:hypothetical protein
MIERCLLLQFIRTEDSSVFGCVHFPDSVFAENNDMASVANIAFLGVRNRPVESFGAGYTTAIKHPPEWSKSEKRESILRTRDAPICVHAKGTFFCTFRSDRSDLELLAEDHSCSGEAGCASSRRLIKMPRLGIKAVWEILLLHSIYFCNNRIAVQ